MALRDMPQIEAVGAAFTGPYANSNWGSGSRLAGGRNVHYGVNSVTDSYAELCRFRLSKAGGSRARTMRRRGRRS